MPQAEMILVPIAWRACSTKGPGIGAPAQRNVRRLGTPRPDSATVLARSVRKGVEAMVVAIEGTTDRHDQSTYHITWSLGEGRRARESNDVLRKRGWDELDDPIPIKLEPGRF